MGVAHTLTRCMFWSDNILRKEDIEGRRMTVVLSQKDIIVDADSVGRYLTRGKGIKAIDNHRGDEWKEWHWSEHGLDVLKWLDGPNYAEIFNTRTDREILVQILMNCCKGTFDPIPKRVPTTNVGFRLA